MPLIQLPLQLPATVGVNPNIRYMVTTDPLATITASSYLNAGNLEGYTVSTNDILFVLYSYSTNTKTGSFGIFTVGITNGVITLSAWADTTNITLPLSLIHILFWNFVELIDEQLKKFENE